MLFDFVTPGTQKQFTQATLLFVVLALAECAYQYFALSSGQFYVSLLRGFALTGATLIGLSLIIGPLFTLTIKYNFIAHRRFVGVYGFIAILFHVLLVSWQYFNFDLSQIYYTVDPFKNPVVFGSLAFTVLILLALTSADKIILKLKYKNWRRLHALIYLGYPLAILHFGLVNPQLLRNPAGYALIAVTLIALILQLAGFIKKVKKNPAQMKPLTWLYALLVLVLSAGLFWIGFSPMFFH